MQSKFANHAVLSILLICQFSICLGKDTPDANDTSKYLSAVREFADNVLKYGRDTYGPKHTPLFVDGLMVRDPNDPNYGRDEVFKPVEWITPNGDRWILSNLASQQNLFRTLDGLSKITGDPKYRQAAMEAIEYAFENLRSPNGLLYWGSAAAYDALGDRVRGMDTHVLKGYYPYYELMWEVNSQTTRQIVESFWAAHINDWSNLDMDRYGSLYRYNVAKGWDHEYKGGPVFFKSVEPWGLSFRSSGSSLFYAAAIHSRLSGEKEPLVWAKRLAYRYVETQHPQIGISSVVYNLYEPVGYQFGDDFNTVTVHIGSFFPQYPFRPFDSNTESPQPNIYPLICQLLLGERLGLEGKEFTQWALDELTAWGKVAYRREDNSWIPMLIDGTKLEGYTLKKDGYFGVKGTVCKPWPTRPVDFYTYSLAFRLTENQFMWEMARSIAAGLELGDTGVNSKVEPNLQLNTQCSDLYVVLAFLELYQKTGNRAFLQAAQMVGDNILRYRFEKGFFVPSKKHIYVRFDALEPFVLLHLDVAAHSKEVLLPQIWPNWSFFYSPYRYRGRPTDVNLIYSLTESAEPPRTLYEAAIEGDINEVRQIILKGADINGRKYKLLSTALHHTVISGNADAVELLLAEGADVEAGNNYASRVLHYAAQKGHKEVVELLISKGANVNARNAVGDTPLHEAERAEHEDIIRLLIDNGADVNVKNNEGLTPADVALGRIRKVVAPLTPVAKLLIAKGADISVVSAVHMEDLDKARELIRKGASVNVKDERGRTALHYAAAQGHKDIVEILLANGADVNAGTDLYNKAPAEFAMDANHNEVAELLISRGADISPLNFALHKGDTARAKSLIEAGADVNKPTPYGTTPMQRAVDKGFKYIVELLITHGADVNARDNWNWTPLHSAVYQRTDVVELLIAHGADVNARDGDGRTPLWYAQKKGYTDLAELLRKHGAKEDKAP